jgi:hypothetical protein
VGAVRFHQHATYGYQMYRLVRASGAALTSGLVQLFAAASSEVAADCATASPPSVKVAGIAQNAIADGYWGWVLCGGKGLATAGAGDVTAGDAILPFSSGKVVRVTVATGAATFDAAAVQAVKDAQSAIGKTLTSTLADATATVLLSGLV